VKINEGFQAEFAKANEERSRRVKELENIIVSKNKRIEDLQKEIYQIKAAKDEKINELQGFVAKKVIDEKELEFRLNSYINK